jgi:hypothetical protein
LRASTSAFDLCLLPRDLGVRCAECDVLRFNRGLLLGDLRVLRLDLTVLVRDDDRRTREHDDQRRCGARQSLVPLDPLLHLGDRAGLVRRHDAVFEVRAQVVARSVIDA